MRKKDEKKNKCLRKFETNTTPDTQDKEVMTMRTYVACRILKNHRENLHSNCLPY